MQITEFHKNILRIVVGVSKHTHTHTTSGIYIKYIMTIRPFRIERTPDSKTRLCLSLVINEKPCNFVEGRRASTSQSVKKSVIFTQFFRDFVKLTSSIHELVNAMVILHRKDFYVILTDQISKNCGL